jgi:DNA invertase Pin-like site-specific DNA recombinase
MHIGYACVSTDDQDLRHQLAALKAAGCQRFYEENASGAKRDRPALTRLLSHVHKEDVLVVTRLDRLARSTRDLLKVAARLQIANVGLRSLTEPWADTTSHAGRMVLTVFTGISEFEHGLIYQRGSAGRQNAKQRGVRFGRAPKLGPEQLIFAQRLMADGKSGREVARVLKCHAATLYRALARLEDSLKSRGTAAVPVLGQ